MDKDGQEWPVHWPAHAVAPAANQGHLSCVPMGNIHPERKYVAGALPFSCVC